MTGGTAVFASIWTRVAFAASAGAAGAHFAAVRPHLDEYAPAGAFMLIAALAQLVWAAWVVRGAPRRVLEAGAAGNAAIVALWLATRTAGLPFGPDAGMPEHIHGADLVATALEVLAVVAAIALASDRPFAVEPVVARLAIAGALATLVVTGDDPARDRSIAAATLAVAVAVRSFLAALPRPIVVRSDRRSHVQVPFAGRLGGRVRAVVGAAGSTRW